LQSFHIVINVATEDSISVDTSIIRSGFRIFEVSRELFGVVGDVNSSVTGSLKGTKNFVTNSGIGKTNVKNGFEGSSVLDVIFNGVVLSVNGLASRVHFVHGSLL